MFSGLNFGSVPRKHGVIGFTKSAAMEYAAKGIRVNDVCPGMIRTAMSDQMEAAGQGEALKRMLEQNVPMKREGKANEIADAVLFLCSDKQATSPGSPSRSTAAS